ncbi:MAG: ABC transporter substrate-binding protein [Micromonosporaceae bacterium]
MRSRRRGNRVWCAAAAAALTLATAGCGLSGGEEKSGGGSGGIPDGKIKGTISFATLQLKPTFTKYIEGVIDEFESKHPGVTVKWVDIPFQGAQERITNDAQSDTLADVVNLNPNFAQQLIAKGVFHDIEASDPKLSDTYVPGAWDAFRIPGKSSGAYAVPWYLTSEVTMYNTDLYEKAGLDPKQPPKTIDELLDQAEEISKAGKGKFHAWHPALENTFITHLAKLGVPLVNDEATKWTFNTPEAVDYLTRLRDLYKSGAIAPDHLTQDHSKAIEAYSAGKVATFPSGPNFLKLVKENAPKIAKHTAVGPQVTGPGGATNMSVMGLLVPKASKNPATAFEFAKFMANAENQLAFCKDVAILPSTVDSLDDPYFTDTSDGTAESLARKISAEQLADARNLVPVQYDDRTKAAVIGKVQLAMKGELDPKRALDEAVAEANKLLAS